MTSTSTNIFATFEDTEQIAEFLHDCVNTLLTTDSTENINHKWRGKQFIPARKLVTNFYRQRLTDEHYPLPESLPPNAAGALETVFELRKSDVIEALVKEKLILNGHNLVNTFDWKLKWVLGSSKLASIREPICQVDLYCISAGKNSKVCKNVVNFECNLETIDNIIGELNKVKEQLNGV